MDTEYNVDAVGILKYLKSGLTSCMISAITPIDDYVMMKAVSVYQLYLE